MARGSAPAAPEMTLVELLRWSWRQLTSMRTALVLLLLLALAAVPGSVIPQQDVDAFAVAQWQDRHPELTPIYEKLGLFSVFDSIWFTAIYLLLVVSLVGCFVPRTRVYWRALRAAPPAAPRNLSRLPDQTSYTTAASPDEVLAATRSVLKGRRYRVSTGSTTEPEAVSGERGYLREAGNLLFHMSVLVVLAGFAIGSLFGYKGAAIVLVGGGFSNQLTQYDDFKPGELMSVDDMEPFSFTVDDFDIDWIREPGPGFGMSRSFVAHLNYRETPDGAEREYDLKVNHPLQVGKSEVFLNGHGYAPVITIRDAEGNVVASGPTPFIPDKAQLASMTSFGVVKAPGAEPKGIGLEGQLYPSYEPVDGNPVSVFGDDLDPVISMLAYVGDLGLDTGAAQSIYVLDKDRMRLLERKDGSMFRVDLQPCSIEKQLRQMPCRVKLPDGAGSVTFERLQPWVQVNISRTPGAGLALSGVILALIGLLGSLFIRPRRVWVRARREGDETVVEVAGLDRSSGGDVATELDEIVAALKTAADTGVPEEKQ